MKVAIYSRKSRMTGKGESIQNQIDLCKQHMKKYSDVEDFYIYEDEGFSGGNSDRPQYQKMLEDARLKKFSTLICYRLDRISRNISDFSDTIEMLKSLDIAFISLREQFDTSTPMGRAMMYIASVFAQLERETIAERIKDNMLSLARTGRWLGGNPPTGYVSECVEFYDDNLNKKTMHRLKHLPYEISVVKEIFDKYLELGSLNKVELWALNHGIKTCRGNSFDITGIRAILTNMVYVKADLQILKYCKLLNMDIASDKDEFDAVHGLMVYNKTIVKKGHANKLRPTSEWIVAVGKHIGVISSSQFIKVQNNISNNKSLAPRPVRNNISLLSSLLKCDICGSSLRTTYGNKKKDGTRLYYYKCTLKEKSRGNLCDSINLNGTNTDKLIMTTLKTLTISFSHLLEFLKVQREDISFLKSIHKDSSNSIKKDIDKYKTMIYKLTTSLSLTKDIKSSKYIIKQIEDLDEKIVKSSMQLESILNTNTLGQSDILEIEKLEDLIIHFDITLCSLTNIEIRHILNTILDSIVWNGILLQAYFK